MNAFGLNEELAIITNGITHRLQMYLPVSTNDGD
jgi:hypothetical protein